MKSSARKHQLLLAGLLLMAIGSATSCGSNNQAAVSTSTSGNPTDADMRPLSSDASMDNYIKTHQSGLKVLPWPLQMEALFGKGDHFITHYGFSPGPKTWNSEMYFGGRYSITLQVEVDIDYQNHLIKGAVSPPKFYISEVDSLQKYTNGSYSATYSNGWVLDEAQWNKLVAAKGDWSVLGIPIKTNEPPIPGFDEFVKNEHAPRIPIPH